MSEDAPNIVIQPEVSGLYGPGVYVSWILTIVSAVWKLGSHPSRAIGPDGDLRPNHGFLRHILTAEVATILLFPVVAAGDVLVRLSDSSTDWDHIRNECSPFNIFWLTILRDGLPPEDTSQEFLSKCEGLRLPLGILQFFLTLEVIVVVFFLLGLSNRFSPRNMTTLLNIVMALPPLWCLAACISASAIAGRDTIVVYFVEGYLRLIGCVALFAVLSYFYFGLFLTSASLKTIALEVRAAFDPRGMPPLGSRLFLEENAWRLARVAYYLLVATVPLGLASYGIRVYIFNKTARALLFMDGVAGMYLTELDQVMSVVGGLVNLGYTLHSTGTLSRMTAFFSDIPVGFRDRWNDFSIGHRFLMPSFLERGERPDQNLIQMREPRFTIAT